MKTSLGDDCVVIHLDYDAVKEVVQIVSNCRDDYERPRLSADERDKNFTLRFRDRAANQLRGQVDRQWRRTPSSRHANASLSPQVSNGLWHNVAGPTSPRFPA